MHGKKAEKHDPHWAKKSINWKCPKSDINVSIAERDIYTIFITVVYMFKNLEAWKVYECSQTMDGKNSIIVFTEGKNCKTEDKATENNQNTTKKIKK